jgi:hypothetical protein
MRWIFAAVGLALGFLAAAAPAAAQPRNDPELIGVKHVTTIKPVRGFVDDPFVFDGAGGRLLYVAADAGYLAELRVIDLTQGGAQLAKIDISKFTTTPIAVRFVSEGYFVVSRPSRQDPATAAVIDGSGKVVRKFGPAKDIVLTSRDGNPVVALYSVARTKARKGKPMFQHKVELVSLDGKKKWGKPRVLVADEKGHVAKLDFRINHWAEGYTRVVGIKGGSWDAKEDQRSPDHEAWYDMFTGVISKRIDITDVMGHAYLMRTLAAHPNEAQFLSVAEKLTSLDFVTAQARQPIELAQPFRHYDPQSLQYQPTEDGLFFFTLTIDPVNQEAVARKKADPQYLDLYEYRAGDKKATRRARILLKSKRTVSWRASGEFWVLVPRLMGFDRGGKELQIYTVQQ